MPPSPSGSAPGLDRVHLPAARSASVALRPNPRNPDSDRLLGAARVVRVVEAAVRVGLPRLDERVGDRVARAVVDRAADRDPARRPLRDDLRAVVPGQADGQERADGLRRRRLGAHACGSSNGVCSRPRSTTSNGTPAPTPARVASRSKRRHQPVPGALRDRVEDRVLGEQRVVREVHLGHQPLGERAPEQREVDVRGPPGVVVVAPRVGARLDRGERVVAVGVGEHPPAAGEVRVQRGRPVVAGVPVATGRVRLPDLDQRVRHRPPVRVQHASGDDDPLAECLAVVLTGQVVVHRPDRAGQQRAGDLGQPVRQHDGGLRRRAQPGAAVAGVVQRGVRARSGRAGK